MTNHCPKCQSHELYYSAGAPVGRMNRIYKAGIVTYVVCRECGYAEGYLLNPFDRMNVSNEWDMVKEVNFEAFEKREMLPVSMMDNRCPACGERDIRQSMITDALSIADSLVATLTHLVCLNCGHVEKYVLSEDDREAIAEHWTRTSRPPTRE